MNDESSGGQGKEEYFTPKHTEHTHTHSVNHVAARPPDLAPS